MVRDGFVGVALRPSRRASPNVASTPVSLPLAPTRGRGPGLRSPAPRSGAPAPRAAREVCVQLSDRESPQRPAVVTGATGWLGKNLVRALVAQGRQVDA